MKNIRLSVAALACILAATTVHAQSTAVYASNRVAITTNDNGNDNTEEPGIDARAVKNFKKDYRKAENAKWQEVSDGFITKFMQKNSQYRVGYNKKGDWQYTERIYNTGSELPVDVRKNIETNYFGFDIKLVEEIATRQRTVYIVHIENAEWIMKLKVDGADIDSLEEFKK